MYFETDLSQLINLPSILEILAKLKFIVLDFLLNLLYHKVNLKSWKFDTKNMFYIFINLKIGVL